MTNEIKFPEARTHAAPEAQVVPQPGPIRLWLVDDNHRLRSTLRETLVRLQGIECTRDFDSPNAVLSALASKPGPDVILLDIQMGDQNGLDAVRPILSLSRSTRVLMLTTFYDNESYERAMADGAAGFLLKHYSLEKILVSIQKASTQPQPVVRRRRKHPVACATQSSPGSPGAAAGGLRSAGAIDANSNRAQGGGRGFLNRCLALFRNTRN